MSKRIILLGVVCWGLAFAIWMSWQKSGAYRVRQGNDKYQAGDIGGAIADYDRAIALDANFLHAYNNRGAVYQKTGDFDRAIADYQVALRIDPQSETAAWNLADARRARDSGSKPGTGATASNVTLPSFDCATATRAAEKAICSDPDLARLDTEIDAAYKAALAARSGKAATQLRQEERDFIAARNTSFGNPSYNLRHEMEARLAVLRGSSASLSR
jgi:tetratricopeptide (TPR) repeat protein